MRLHPFWSGVVVCAVFVSVAGAASAQTFVFDLSGAQEVPPVPTSARGGCFGQLDQPAAQFSLTCVHNVVNATLMHIHHGAAGVNGPIAFDLGNPASPVVATWTGMTPADIADLVSGNLYIDVHSAGRPAGEIRGQILPRTVDLVNFTATGAQVVPSNATTATGTCTADLDGPATALAIQCTHTLPGPVSAHVHESPELQTGPVIFTFASPASPLAANVPMTPQLVADFAAAFLYLDVHTAGSEEIRGRIGTPSPVHLSVTAPAAATAGVPFDVTVTARDQLDNVVTGYTGTVHFTTTDAGPGSAAPADYPFTAADAGTKTFANGATFVTPGTQTLTATDTVDATVTGTSDNVFVFNQTAQLFVFGLRGDQMVPSVSTPATGGCFGQFDAGVSVLGLTCVHNAIDATTMTIRHGSLGVNGPIVFDLGSPTSPRTAVWTGLTPADVADLLAGNFYVALTTACRPSGEVRGQILPRTVDTVNFTATGAQVVPPDATGAAGSCTANLSDDATVLAMQCTHNVPAPNAAHVHEGPVRQTGPTVFTFPSPTSPLSGNVPMTSRLIADFAATFLYLDVHSAGGTQIRGQIGTPPPSQATHLALAAPASVLAGSSFSLTVTALDACERVALDYAGTVHFTKTDAGAGSAVPADYTFTGADAGVKTFTGGATFVSAGNRTVTATDSGNASITGTSNVVAVSPAAATHFTVNAPATATAGSPFTFTVTALDQFNNVVTSYTGTVQFTENDPGAGATAPANYTFMPGDAGVKTFTNGATFVTAGNRMLTATDTGNAGITGNATVAVNATVTTHLTVIAPATATAGSPFNVTVTARDQFNNVATGYTGTVRFTTTDAGAGSAVPANYTFVAGDNGAHIFTNGVTLATSGNRTVTATDTGNASITGTSNVIAVSAAAATHFTIAAPPVADPGPGGAARPRAAGTAISLTVTARDQFDNVATGYGGTVHFTSSDPLATLPVDSPLTNGVGTFSATLRTAGSQTITARDTVTASIVGTGSAIVVSPAAATHFRVDAPATAGGGVPFSFTVTALDAFDNVATGYVGTVRFTSSDALATLPADAPLTNGVGVFSATLKAGGPQTLTATDTVDGSITGSDTINASAAPIPTLSTWVFVATALLLAATAFRSLGRPGAGRR